MALNITVTTAGRAALVNAANTGTAPVTVTQIGLTATAVVPAVGMTALAGEFKRIGAVGGEVVADDVIHVSMLDDSADAYTLRSFALYLQDGTLFAVYGQAGPIIEKTASSFAALAVDVIFADIDAALLTFGDTSFMVPTATTERQGVVELATVAEAQAGIDALRALTPATAKAAILGWLLTQDGAGSGLDADLLRGLSPDQVVSLARVLAALGYTPVNRAGDTMTGSLGFTGGTGVVFGNVHASEKHVEFARAGYTAYIYGNAAGFGAYDTQYGSIFDWGYGNNDFNVRGWKVCTAGNDGSGSGFDSDLLDGQHGSYYTDIVARLGYVPINKAGDNLSGVFTFTVPETAGIASRPSGNTPLVAMGNGAGGPALMTFHRPGSYAAFFGIDTDNQLKFGGWSAGAVANVIWHAANDGSGSGMDSDLLDGQHGSYYTDIVGRLGYTPLNQASYTAAAILAKLLTVDGSGCALDADTVDGFHASHFARPTTNSLGATGERIYADGYKKCWGQITVAKNSSATVTLPFTFSSVPRVIVGASVRSSTVDEENGGLLPGSETVSSFTIVNGFEFAGTFPWEAFGK